MSIFGDILHKIFHQPPPPTTPEHAPDQPTPAPTQPHTPDQPTAAPDQPTDAATILQGLAQHSTEPLDWQHSIVDLMKLLGLDSSLAHRTMLAQELGYQGDMSDTAQMNIWLHMEVIKRLQEHGGTVPDELKS